MITPDEVRARLNRIYGMRGDPEAAHGAEDDLWREVLEAIADGAEDPRLLARLALGTAGFLFERWYA